MAYYKRIGDNDMTSEFVDGSVLLHTDMNEIETLTKTGINANYEDIQKLQDGTLTVQTAVNATNAVNATIASQLSGATLSKSTDEDLQDSDTKVPTSKQVKDYVDSIDVDMDYADATNKPSINGVTLIGNKTTSDLHIDVDVPFYYWNGLNTANNVAMFNEICDKYTNGEKFILVGKVALENGYTYNGTFYERTIDVVTPFNVKDFTEYEDTENTGHSVYSFMTEPVRTTGGYAIGSVDLTGTAWGEFTAISPITWSYSEGPAMSGNTINVVNSLPAADYTTVGKIYQYNGATDSTHTFGYFYTCTQTGPSTYEWVQLNVQPSGGSGGGDIQHDTMPTADATNEGEIYQYTGTTDSTFTNGYFYKSVAQGTTPETYAWEAISVQAGGGGGLTNLSDVANGGLQQTTCTVNRPDIRTNSVALGYQTTTNGLASLAEGYQTKTLGQAAHAEGQYTIALGMCSHAEGQGSDVPTQANYIGARGSYSHSEGFRTCAAGTASHAEGYGSPDSQLGAYGNYSHTEGSSCHASAENAHAEGAGCRATGNQAHAEGLNNYAASANSHVEGIGNQVAVTSNTETHIQGRYAVPDQNGEYAHIVGNGTSSAQSNAHTIDWSGNAWFAGDIKVGGTGYSDTSADTLVKKSYVDNMSIRLPYRMGKVSFSGLELPAHSSESATRFTFALPSEYTGADTVVLQTYIGGVSGGQVSGGVHYYTHASVSDIGGDYFIVLDVYYGTAVAETNVTFSFVLCEF